MPEKIEYQKEYYQTKEFANFLKAAFGYEFYENKTIPEFISPIAIVKSKIFGNRLISSAQIEYGGIPLQIYNPIILKDIKKRYQNNFDFLEIRGSANGSMNPNEQEAKFLGLTRRDDYKRFVLNLSQGEEVVWQNIQKSKRKAIKKSENLCSCRELTIDDLDEFYRLYLRNMKSFGSPPYSKKYFKLFFEMIQNEDMGKIYASFVKKKKRNGKDKEIMVSALLGFYYGNRIHITTAISDPKYANYRPSDLMHWYFIKLGLDNNYHYFDFGRVREESGQFEFKRKWGAELKELPSFYLPLKKQEIPTPLDPTTPLFKLASFIWRKLLPTKVTELIGMKLRKDIGI